MLSDNAFVFVQTDGKRYHSCLGELVQFLSHKLINLVKFRPLGQKPKCRTTYLR